MKLYSVSLYWRNNEPTGLGVTFGPPSFSPSDLETLFKGEVLQQYIRDSDAHLGTRIVDDYFRQLSAIAAEARKRPLPMSQALIAAFNIIWLCERGFIPNDEFNGPMYTYAD